MGALRRKKLFSATWRQYIATGSNLDWPVDASNDVDNKKGNWLMTMHPRKKLLCGLIFVGLASAAVTSGLAKKYGRNIGYQPNPGPTTEYSIPGLVTFQSLVNETTLGSSDLEIALVSQQPPAHPPEPDDRIVYHTHQTVEAFYILEGVLVDTFAGDPNHPYRYKAGDIAVVRPGDSVNHRAEEPVKAIAIWSRGGELARFAQGGPWQVKPLPQPPNPRTRTVPDF